ncbi:TetR/AcrR family transcriptional regulator [Pseudolysinimonas sp.]|uniref:TetR/AcrR family transcriptional regulator n=1 Tax=Pseudolysinimonas sp. TaxID=2680009 RepID=UPI003782D714
MKAPGRNELRKAETRRKISAAANVLFLDKGYTGTSMEEIAAAADVAIRTLYLHFESKAAILLDFFDAWLDEFVRLMGERPAGERLDDTLARTLTTMTSNGWDDNKKVDEVTVLHPVLEFIGGGAPEIAGHIMQRWVAAQEVLTDRFRATAGATDDDPRPRVDAAAVFATWMVSVLEFRTHFANGGTGPSTHDAGSVAIRTFVDGLGPRR